MSKIVWRWEERDFGFRFRGTEGNRRSEYYQARSEADFYVVPASERKLTKVRVDELATSWPPPRSPRVVPNPWLHYDRDWDHIATEDGICLNCAGCLDAEEVNRREDEGVQRAMELVAGTVGSAVPVPLSVRLIQQLHIQLMGDIYPFAGRWRTVPLHKGSGPVRWPMPPGGIEPLMQVLERDVLSRSPVLSDEDADVFGYASEVMNELLAIHPFREGNGRMAFVAGNLILMQNDMLPLTVYERHRDEERYFAACEAGRLSKNYGPLASLVDEWEDRAIQGWTTGHDDESHG